MIFLALAVVAALVVLVIWRADGSLLWAALTLIAGVAAYALTGAPQLAGAPAPTYAEAEAAADVDVERLRGQLASDPANTQLWGAFARALIDADRGIEAVEGLNFAASTLPPNADLQVELGTALMMHAGGVITPAAQLAFGRASELDPDHPAPLYFLGMAHLQSGEPARAIEAWQTLAARTPPGAPWEADLTRKLNAAETMMAAGVGSGG
ncbi:MAG: cytochrome C biosynthesis protein [Pacificimonas sp.]|jgi:cytochrome c-type biogenesis protein CcmH|nr:cytochrome C biosynthesis protein [Pacificimonas sp.]